MSKYPMSCPSFESRTSNSNSRINALINVKLPHPPLPGNPLDIWTFRDWFIQIPTNQDQNNNQTPHQSAAFDRQFVFVQGSSDLNILVDLSTPIFLKIKHTYSAEKTWQVQFEFPTPPRQSSNSQPQAWNTVNYPRLPGRGGCWSFQLFKEKQVYFTYSGKVWTPIYKSHIVFCKPGKQLQAVLRKKMKWKGTFVLTNIHQTMPGVGTTVYKSLLPAKVTGTASPATFIVNKCWWKISTEKPPKKFLQQPLSSNWVELNA